MPNVAIFGGTFNPIHWGHLFIAETALDQFHLDRVIWAPTFCPPHKASPLATFEQRLAMVGTAIADHPAFDVSAVDAQQGGTSYAIATLQALQASEPDACWYWIIGNDAFQTLPRWKASQALAAQCTWLVAPRALTTQGEQRLVADRGALGDEEAEEGRGRREAREVEGASLLTLTPHPPHLTLNWHRLEMPSIVISSSLIRQRCREGRSIRYLVPEAVRCYIIEQLLY